jgi:hypothetical protein
MPTKSLRYRDHACGLTRISLKALKNLSKLGKLTKIKGYRFRSRRTAGYTYPIITTHEAVLIYGKNGQARYEGVLWGYSGQGPRGLVELLLVCGINKSLAENTAFHSERRDTIGIDWELHRISGYENSWRKLPPCGNINCRYWEFPCSICELKEGEARL